MSEKNDTGFDAQMAVLRTLAPQTVIAKAVTATGSPIGDKYECLMWGIVQDPHNPIKFFREYTVMGNHTHPEQSVLNICQSRCAELDVTTGEWVIMIGDC